MIADIKSPADPPRAATREQKSAVEIEHSNTGLPQQHQQQISQSVAQSFMTAAEKVSTCLSQKSHGHLKKLSNRSNIRNQLEMLRRL
jgi:hypothetical protein